MIAILYPSFVCVMRQSLFLFLVICTIFSRVKCMSVPVYSSLVVLKPKIPESKYQINYYIIFNRYPLHHHIAEIIPQNSIFMDSAPNHFGNLHKPI